MQQPSKLVPAIWGGVVIAILSSVPVISLINCACCAGVIIGGAVAVYLYRRDLDPRVPMLSSDGALLGLLAGAIGAVMSTAITAALGGLSLEWLKQMAELADNPELDNMIGQFSDSALAQGLIFMVFVVNLITDCIAGMVGGVIGVALFGKAQTPPEWQQPPAPPAAQ